MNRVVPILHNVRSLHNVGAILRTAEGLGAKEVWVSGYTPYPQTEDDERLPHVSKRATEQIAKTSLGAEKHVSIKRFETVEGLIKAAKTESLELIAIEQSPGSVDIKEFDHATDAGLIFGNEVEGLDQDLLEKCDHIIAIPMRGKKESFNVSATAAIVLYTVINKFDC